VLLLQLLLSLQLQKQQLWVAVALVAVLHAATLSSTGGCSSTRPSLFRCDRVVFLCSAWLQARAAAMAERKQQRSEAKEWLDEAVPKLTGK
jgi:hypothetical protein